MLNIIKNKLQRKKKEGTTIRVFTIFLLSSFLIGFITGCKGATLSTGADNYSTTHPTTPTTTTPTTTTPTTPVVNNGYQQYQESLTVPTQITKLDVIFCVDNSSSMSQEQSRLGAGFNSFTRQLIASNLDYQVGFITSDMLGTGPTQDGNLLPIGRNTNNGYILASGDTNQAYNFQRTIERPEIGSSDERCIYAAITAIKRNQNGIIRSDADLAIIIISDEDSRGEGGTHGRPLISGKDYGTDLATEAARIKGNKKVTIGAIIVKPGSNDNCLYQQQAQGEDASPQYGVQYQAAADATNGVVGSICDANYNYHLEQMSQRLVSTDISIDLQCVPDQTEGREVIVEGFSESSYSVSGSSIVFNSPVTQGDTINYSYWCRVN